MKPSASTPACVQESLGGWREWGRVTHKTGTAARRRVNKSRRLDCLLRRRQEGETRKCFPFFSLNGKDTSDF